MAGLRKEVRKAGSADKGFGLHDADGRGIGYRCDIFEERWVIDPERATLFVVEGALPLYTDRQRWAVHGRATRDGKGYGASSYPRRVGSIEEAFCLAERMIEAYRKKAAKKFC
jgi:hypothetical protein